MTDGDRVVVRPAGQNDLPALGELGALLVRMHYTFDPERFLAPMRGLEEGYASFLEAFLDRTDAVVFVAERAGEVIGYTYATIEGSDYMALRGPAAVLHDIVVRSDHRGQGVGSMLLDATLGKLADLGAPRVVITTADRNEAAQRLFARAGFRRTMIEMTRELHG